MKIRFLYISIIILVLAIAGCSSTNPPVAPGVTVLAPSPTVETNGYPVPPTFSAYPGPDGSQQLPPVTKVPTVNPQTPDPNLAIVKGKLLLNDQPLDGYILYLAQVIYGENGGRVAKLNRETSPRTVSDADGNFVFINVPSGEYGLVLDRVIDSYLLLTPAGDTLIVTITSNEEIDMGELNYDDLPIIQE